jgi:valyl-tRNA synthetase
MTEELSKAYESKEVESRWYAAWEKAGAFLCRPDSKAEPFTLVLPPPNVTGQLHIGHAFSFTLQDVVVRYERMRGRDVLWLPGLDHAGIATQLVVERQLAAQGKRKEDLGREAFEAKVWEWKATSGDRIFEQLRVMGFSLDWSKQRFTLEPALSRAVREAFVSLYEEGLIYRGTYVVNWCTRCGTALSDLEVESSPEAGSLWYIRYPGEGGGEGIVVATTRPETLLGDTAVAVNPEDERYKGIVGQSVVLPILGRKIPVLADSFVDTTFGTGAVKITPAHDPNDFQTGARLHLPSIIVMDERGAMNENAGPYAGKDRFEARKLIVADLQAQGLLVKTVPHEVPLGRCQRCDTVVEPRLSLQWFLKMKPLAEPAIAAVEDGRIRFVPEEWSKTYFGWMRNIRDWCVSRQLWWGHRIPAWTCACGEVVVSREDPPSCPKCGGALTQVADVLDTWFSSGLFPFSTMGWPDKTKELARYYPNSLMMTAFDIIFFWVARMIFFGIRFMGEAPFPVVCINGLVRDEKREKMSKLKGNAVDPLELVAQHGADAVRLTLTALATPGADPSFALARLLGYKAFVNKLWNASRFALMNLEGEIAPSYVFQELPLPSRWILTRLQEVTDQTRAALGEFRHDLATHELYHFVWDEFCAWYVEIAKVLIGEEREAARGRLVLLEVLDGTLRLLHPFIPFVTEEIWQRLPLERATAFLMLAPYPEASRGKIDPRAKEDMARLMELVSGIRTIRSTYEVAPKRSIDVTVVAPRAADREFLASQESLIASLARTRELVFVESAVEAPRTIKQPVGEVELRIPMADLFDLAAEKTRLSKERLKLENEREGLKKKFENPNFVERARAEVVEEARTRLSEIEEKIQRIVSMLKELGG